MDGEILANQLSQLGRQLDDATDKLAELDIEATATAIECAHRKELYEDALAYAFSKAEGSVENRKTSARLNCIAPRLAYEESYGNAERAKSAVRNQQAMIRALNSRIDIGRSLLSREKTLAVIT